MSKYGCCLTASTHSQKRIQNRILMRNPSKKDLLKTTLNIYFFSLLIIYVFILYLNVGDTVDHIQAAVLQFLHLVYDLLIAFSPNINQSKRCDIYAVISEILQVICLQILFHV